MDATVPEGYRQASPAVFAAICRARDYRREAWNQATLYYDRVGDRSPFAYLQKDGTAWVLPCLVHEES